MKVRNPILLAAAAAALTPSSALAASATVTGDAGTPVPLGGAVTIRHMSPAVNFTFDATEKRYSAGVTGPDGQAASFGTSCKSTASPFEEAVRYRGNGDYVVALVVSKNEDDSDCSEGTRQELRFTINAYTTLTPPATKVLTREPGSLTTLQHAFKVDLNPGAGSHELRYSTAADGGATSTQFERGFVDDSGTAGLRFFSPGTYRVVARATRISGGTEFGTPFTQPVVIQAFAPFDLVGNPYFPDSRGPVYKVRGQIREKTATGKVAVAIARGKRGGKFKRLGNARIRKGGTFQLRFTLRRKGHYRLRYLYKGNSTVAPGGYLQPIQIKRRSF